MEFKKYQDKGAYHWEEYNKNPHYRKKTDEIVKMIGNNKRVLDIGCGDGLITEKIGKKNTVIGIDNNKEGIKLARDKCLNVEEFRLGDALNLPFKDEEFDVVLMADLIEHVKKEKQLLKEAHRVTKENGSIIISTPLKREKGPFHDEEHHIREYSIRELKESTSTFYQPVKIEIIEKEKFHYSRETNK